MAKRAWDEEQSGKALHKLIKRSGLTDREVADRCGVPVKTVSEWKRGRQPHQRHMEMLDAALDLDAEDWEQLYPTTAAQQDRDADRARRHAELSKRVVTLDDDGWQPVQVGTTRDYVNFRPIGGK